MARGVLRPLLALCLCSHALSTSLRSRSSSARGLREVDAEEEDELVAMGDEDMVAAEEAIGRQRQSIGTGIASRSAQAAAAAAAAEAAAADEEAEEPTWEEAIDEAVDGIGTTLSNAARTAGKYIRAGMNRALGKDFGKRDLAFIHVPMNFGQAVERVGLMGERAQDIPMLYQSSFEARNEKSQWNAIKMARGSGGEIWGQMDPELRAISNETGCNLYHTPQKYWPDDLAQRYFAGKRAFGLLRDPYDKVVAEFRQLATGGDGHSVESLRRDIAEQEGAFERQGQEYLDFYDNCDVNGWVKAELNRVRKGDTYRGNCHLVPQTEYFEHPHGISLPIDARLIPESFNEAMEEHNYPIRMDSSTVRTNWKCNKISAWSLDEESKSLVKEVYAGDFDLLCKTFGYCDNEELTCMQQFSSMCGGSPYDTSMNLFGA